LVRVSQHRPPKRAGSRRQREENRAAADKRFVVRVYFGRNNGEDRGNELPLAARPFQKRSRVIRRAYPRRHRFLPLFYALFCFQG
jgi:hypothetical protein